MVSQYTKKRMYSSHAKANQYLLEYAMNKDVTESHSSNDVGNGNRGDHKKKVQKCLRQANSIYDLPSTEQAIEWMHAVCGYPVKLTWLKAIKAGNYIRWPMLTECNVNKYYPETSETSKGHMNQTCKNVLSTKAKQTPLEICDTSQLHSKKVRDIYTTMYDVHETIFSDQTGRFPTCLQSGNKYIMVLVEINSNAILVEPMKIRKDAEMIQAYNALLL